MSAFSANGMAVQGVFNALDEAGVREYVVCAGARNAALLEVVAARVAQDVRFSVYHFFDERSAAFFALGRIIKSRRAVAVMTTSGTAVAELLPAMVEAYYQCLPLIAVTADRPPHYAGSGAPQAIEQGGIFGVYANSLVNGPRHFNVPLEEEGIGAEAMQRCMNVRDAKTDQHDPFISGYESEVWETFWRGTGEIIVLVAGLHPEDAREVASFLVNLGVPVVAEATANLSGYTGLQPLMMHGGERALRSINVKRALRIGAVPSWRWWRDLESRLDVAVLNISRAPFRGLARQHGVADLPWSFIAQGKPDIREKKGEFVSGQNVKLDDLLTQFPNSEIAWMRHLSLMQNPGARVMLGNSLPIREWNLAARPPQDGVAFFANRGANGIDGLVSTWLGIGADAAEAWLILGDLSALYDSNALWIIPQLKSMGKRRLVVINNHGGQIFSRVGWLASLPAAVRKIMMNPHALNFAAWADMWGAGYRQFSDWRELHDDDSSTMIWEIKPDAGQSAAFWQAWAS